ncbi:MAG: CHAD domain-containing protein [Sulfuricellaceae bacterium]|nr:CHAD domain-containing protein [Sulfuricellaceae bacterium]
MATEVELKLLIQPADIPKLRRHALIKSHAAGRAKTQTLISIYFDTPEYLLRQNRVALRVRRVGSRWVQTVKGGGKVQAGLHSRGEWEWEVARDQPDLTKIQDPVLLKLFSAPEVRDALKPIFTTEFKRTTWLLQWENGDTVELALDEGEVRNGKRIVPLCEVELELKQGASARLFQAAQELQRIFPLRLDNISKADRGYRLFQRARPPVTKAGSILLKPGMTVAQAFQLIAWSCVDHWVANQEGAISSDDPENIHQLRVALRRLRSALPQFRPAIPQPSSADLAAELKWLACSLGPARNWDVFLTETLPPLIAQFPSDEKFERLRQRAERARELARGEASLALRSHRYDRLLLNLATWLTNESWNVDADGDNKSWLDRPVTELARRVLNRYHKLLHRHGPALLTMPIEERHEVRILVKKLRYAVDFFAALFPAKTSQPYLQSLSSLQEELGTLNDAATTQSLLESFHGEDALSIAFISGWSARGMEDNLKTMNTAWHKFYQCRPFWSE